MEPRGILRNKETDSSKPDFQEELDRDEVIKNTRINAQLASESHKGDQIRAKLAEAKTNENGNANGNGNGTKHYEHSEHLKWDEINLYKTEQEKAATMKIDEPKTPYEGGFNPHGEYYQKDEDQIPDFTLGEGSYEPGDTAGGSLNGGELLPREEPEEPEEEPEKEEEPLTAEERHKRFEEMRKLHYHNAANPLKHSVPDED